MGIVLSLLLAAGIALSGAPASAGEDPAPPIFVPKVDTPWPGKIFVAHDEWAISDYGYQWTPGSSEELVLNVATWFTDGRPGRFLVYSNFYGLVGQRLAATVRGAGHGWTVDTSVPFTLETLRQYDAVFVGGSPEADNSVLIDYVRAGGAVFIEGGTGLGGNIGEASHWNRFLEAFGLALGPRYDVSRGRGVRKISSPSPLFRGVTDLFEDTGSPILKLDPADPHVDILVPYDGHGLYAIYSTSAIPVLIQGCGDLDDGGTFKVTIHGTADFDVTSIDLATVRVLGAAMKDKKDAARLSLRKFTAPDHAIGRRQPDACKLKPGSKKDEFSDLELAFPAEDVMAGAEQSVVGSMYDDDVLVITLTGRLRQEVGGQPIVGEAVVKVHGRGKRPKQK
jgi:hypothetical protein